MLAIFVRMKYFYLVTLIALVNVCARSKQPGEYSHEKHLLKGSKCAQSYDKSFLYNDPKCNRYYNKYNIYYISFIVILH